MHEETLTLYPTTTHRSPSRDRMLQNRTVPFVGSIACGLATLPHVAIFSVFVSSSLACIKEACCLGVEFVCAAEAHKHEHHGHDAASSLDREHHHFTCSDDSACWKRSCCNGTWCKNTTSQHNQGQTRRRVFSQVSGSLACMHFMLHPRT